MSFRTLQKSLVAKALCDSYRGDGIPFYGGMGEIAALYPHFIVGEFSKIP
jgi:hypothetical protein